MALVKVKGTVRPRNLVIFAAVANAAQTLAVPVDVVITSGNDSTHLPTSKHYSGEALDVRTKTFPTLAAKRAFRTAVLARLGLAYQGILEKVGTAQEHLHIEYDPKAAP